MTAKLLPSQITTQLQRRQGQVQRQAAQQGQEFSQTGQTFILQNGPRSESTVHVPFTHIFTEQPTPSAFLSLDTNEAYTPGKAPTISGCVYRWDTEKKGPVILYTGAWIVFVTTAEDGQRLWAHYRFEGRGLSYPTAATSSNATGTA